MRRYLLAFIVCFLLSIRSSAQAGDVTFPSMETWTTGGAIRATKMEQGVRLTVADSGSWGHVWLEGDANLDATPYFAVWISGMSRDAKWLLTANDPAAKILEPGTQDVGLAVYDLRAKTGWTGHKRFRLYLTVQGRGNFIDVSWAGLFRQPPTTGTDISRWSRMNGSLTQFASLDRQTRVSIDSGDGDHWGGLSTKIPVDVDKFPFIETTVSDLAPETRWRVRVGATASGPEHRNNGTVAFNYRDFNPWRGTADVDVQVIFAKQNGGRIGRVDGVRFVRYPTASNALVAATRHLADANGQPLLSTGEFSLRYDGDARVFRVQRNDGSAALATHFLEMPGFDLSPDIPLEVKSTGTGQSITFKKETGGALFTVVVETRKESPGLLHSCVSFVPVRNLRLASCGHEWAYVPAGRTGSDVLVRVLQQNLCATGADYLVAPGIGSVLYWQNLTALNPLFDACQMAPRWLVSASDLTFGCADPLDTGRTYHAGEEFVLSDSYLFLTPSIGSGTFEQSDTSLKGMAAIYDWLPDKPETEYLDWPTLARKSLRDLEDGSCWTSYQNRLYLSTYVGTVGGSPQLTGIQEVVGPLTEFKNVYHQGDSLAERLSASLPDFYTPEHGTLHQFTTPGDHVWWSIEQHIGVSRAALAGDARLKALALKCADTFIRLAHESNYEFQHWSDHDFSRHDLIPYKNEYCGVYLLYMMHCYALTHDAKFLDEAKAALTAVERQWDFSMSRNAGWSALTAEGLGRLYTETKDPRCIRAGIVVLAGMMHNAWLWECDYGPAKAWTTFFGFSSDATGVDYITADDQHTIWRGFREFYLRTYPALPTHARVLISEMLRRTPQSAWYTYPEHLPKNSLHDGIAFWKTNNRFDLAIPVEDLNDGWRKNGSVGQEIYGAGATFTFAANAYEQVPEAGCTVYSECPLLSKSWDPKDRVLTLHVSGVSRYSSKLEVSGSTKIQAASVAPEGRPFERSLVALAVTPSGAHRFEVRGDSIVRLRFESIEPTATINR